MRLSDEAYEEIKQEVVHLLVQLKISSFPINGFDLAKRMNITLIRYSELSEEKLKIVQKLSPDGFFFADSDGKEYIYYNDARGYQRCNMTILHEIGHCVRDHDRKTNPEEAEAEANFFAKYAIAPPPLVHQFKPRCPEDIQAHFCISHEAATYAFSYYHKWLSHGNGIYTSYERELLRSFDFEIAC